MPWVGHLWGFKGDALEVLEPGNWQWLAFELSLPPLLCYQYRWHHRQLPVFEDDSEVLQLSEQQHGYHVLPSDHAHWVHQGLLQDWSWGDPWCQLLWAQKNLEDCDTDSDFEVLMKRGHGYLVPDEWTRTKELQSQSLTTTNIMLRKSPLIWSKGHWSMQNNFKYGVMQGSQERVIESKGFPRSVHSSISSFFTPKGFYRKQ